jgi:hypothetical protein
MTFRNRTLHPYLQRLAPLVLLGVGLGVAISVLAEPLASAIAENRSAKARLARFERLAETPTIAGERYNPDDLSASHVDDAEARIALQSAVDRIARGAGVAVQSVNPMAAEFMGDVGSSVWVEMNLSCDLQALLDLLRDIEAERPVVLLRRLEVAGGEGPRADSFLQVKLEAGRVWRPGEAAP